MRRVCRGIPHTKRICVVTGTRAEYGLLKPLIKRLDSHDGFDLQLVATGTHLSEDFGSTYKEIEKDGIKIFAKLKILEETMSQTMARALIEFERFFAENTPDAIILLGDRYETMAIACAATNARIPIIHLYGGDTTEGAIDEAYRHSITKMSYLHFTSCEESRRRVIQLGEAPERVFNVGALAVDNIDSETLLSLDELESEIKIPLKNGYAVVTFHPVTLENDTAKKQCGELLAALSARDDLSYVITKSNADSGGLEINRMMDDFGHARDNVYVTESLGMRRYLSALKYAKMVIGNSSSGIYEAPVLKVPTVNIGDRQRGRQQAKSIINCAPERNDILRAMDTAMSRAFVDGMQDMTLPYGDGGAAKIITDILEERILGRDLDLKKSFYNIECHADI